MIRTTLLEVKPKMLYSNIVHIHTVAIFFNATHGVERVMLLISSQEDNVEGEV